MCKVDFPCQTALPAIFSLTIMGDYGKYKVEKSAGKGQILRMTTSREKLCGTYVPRFVPHPDEGGQARLAANG